MLCMPYNISRLPRSFLNGYLSFWCQVKPSYRTKISWVLLEVSLVLCNLGYIEASDLKMLCGVFCTFLSVWSWLNISCCVHLHHIQYSGKMWQTHIMRVASVVANLLANFSGYLEFLGVFDIMSIHLFPHIVMQFMGNIWMFYPRQEHYISPLKEVLFHWRFHIMQNIWKEITLYMYTDQFK